MFPTIDTRVIAQYARPEPAPGLVVHAQRHEVMFKNGSSVQLHPVTVAGQEQPDTFLRALQREGLRWLVFDLRKVLGPRHGACLEEDVLRLLPRDTPGVVFYTLRAVFPQASTFITAADACACATWWHADTAPLAEAA